MPWVLLAASCTGDDPHLARGSGDDLEGGAGDGGGGNGEGGAGSGLAIGEVPVIFVMRGASVRVPVTIDRRGEAGDVRLAIEPLPASLSAPPVTLAGGASTGELVVTATAEATQQRVKVQLVAAVGERRVTREVALVVRGQAGERDTTFGAAGALTALTPAVALGIARAEDDSVLVLGARQQGCAVARVDPEGNVDPSFGEGGRVDVDEPSGVCARFAVRNAGGFVLAIRTPADAGTAGVALHAFDAKGKRVTGFGTNGRFAVPGATQATALLGAAFIDEDHVAVGLGTNVGSSVVVVDVTKSAADPRPSADLGPNEGKGVLGGPAGVPIVYGVTRPAGNPPRWTVGRYPASGATFVDWTAMYFALNAGAVDAAGRVVLVGRHNPPVANPVPSGIITRFKPGDVDGGFGNNGFADDKDVRDYVGVAFADGKTYAVGRAGDGVNKTQVAIVRYTDAGARDVTFAASGLALDPDTANAPVDVVALERSPLLVVQRHTVASGKAAAGLVRYWR